MKPIVFAGPSLYGVPRPADPGFDLAPPAGCGDLLRAVRQGRTVIGLIDGTFETGPAVWHKEILYALAQGCTVLGAASMGALRAAECEAFGMVGIGRVFEDYRAGRRTADADVALVHGPPELDHMPLSLALVDAEDAIAAMHRQRLLDAALAGALAAAARTTFFKARTWEGLYAAAGLHPEQSARIDAWLATSGPGLKSRDALLLLDRVVPKPPAAASPGIFIETRFFAKLAQQL